MGGKYWICFSPVRHLFLRSPSPWCSHLSHLHVTVSYCCFDSVCRPQASFHFLAVSMSPNPIKIYLLYLQTPIKRDSMSKCILGLIHENLLYVHLFQNSFHLSRWLQRHIVVLYYRNLDSASRVRDSISSYMAEKTINSMHDKIKLWPPKLKAHGALQWNH